MNELKYDHKQATTEHITAKFSNKINDRKWKPRHIYDYCFFAILIVTQAELSGAGQGAHQG